VSSEKSDDRKQLRGTLEIRPGAPIRFVEDRAAPSPNVSAEQQELSERISRSLQAYGRAARALLAGKFKDLKDYAPGHLKQACDVTVVCCTDGVIVRYDRAKEGQAKIRAGTLEGTLAELAPMFSDFFIHFPPDPRSYDPGPNVPRLHMERVNFATGSAETIAVLSPLILATSVYPPDVPIPPPPHRPLCLVSMANELQFVLSGTVVPIDAPSAGNIDRSRDFLARGPLKLATGWEAIEIYPTLDIKYWNPEYAPLWAENDLLAAVARKQLEDAQFVAIDPNVAARNKFQSLVTTLETLLSGPEEPAHQFLKKHPELLNPVHVACWSKLRFGERISDFVFREPGNEYVLVEIESPLRELFRKDGQQREELTHAFNQILDWRTYIEDHLENVQQRLGLTGISTNPSSLIVIGRSSSLSDENRRKLVTIQNQIPRLRILTYDDLIHNAKALVENLFGPLGFAGENVQVIFPQSTGSDT